MPGAAATNQDPPLWIREPLSRGENVNPRVVSPAIAARHAGREAVVSVTT